MIPRIRGLIADTIVLAVFGAAWAGLGLLYLYLVMSR